MKKVKVLLSAAAVVAIVAGTLASSARTNNKIYTPGDGGLCTVEVQLRKFQQNPLSPVLATTQFGAPCVHGDIIVTNVD
nr:hypothetical protein [uncultured Chitinophaga sp.]